MRTTFRPETVLDRIEHRPYPVPSGPWALGMSWRDLLFMHWPVEVDALRSLVPPTLSIDTFEGSAWLGVVPFDMIGVRPHFLPAVPGLSHFPEINLRTYVTAEGRPGVWFFSLDAHSRVAVRLARATFHLPYFDAEMSCHASGDEIDYRSLRTHRGAPEAKFAARYSPVGEPFESNHTESGCILPCMSEKRNSQQESESSRLEGLYRKASDAVLRTHLLMVWRISEGDSVVEVARMVGYSGKWVREIKRR